MTVGGHAGTDVSPSASALIFTASNWETARTVTVTAGNDDDTANDAVTLTHAAASTDGNYGGIAIAGVSVTVTDNDTSTPTVTLVLSGDSIGENGGVEHGDGDGGAGLGGGLHGDDRRRRCPRRWPPISA